MSWFHAVLTTFFISMVPVLELRGAIPIGVAGGLPPLAAMCIAILGNLAPVPFLLVFTRRVFNWLKTKGRIRLLVERLERRAAKKSRLVLNYAWLGLCILVAIPLPGTGAWTGALVATLFDIRIGVALPAILAGVLIAGGVMTAVSCGVLSLF